MGLVPYPAVERPGQPVVSVCIANYNGEALLDDCITSVLAQDAGESIEIIVHDDASTDGSVELLRSRYPGVELLASTDNVGFCIANNRMVAHAHGEYVLLLNNDAALYPDAIRTFLAAARAAEPSILTLPQYDWETGALVDRGCLIDPFFNPVPNVDPERDDVAYVIGACLWIPRALWRELGGFPEWMESIGEDIFLCCMARLRGIPVRAIPDSGYRHRQGVRFGGNRVKGGKLVTTTRRRRLSERNKTYAMVFFSQHAALVGLLPLHLLLLGAEGLVVGLVRRDWSLVGDIYGSVAASLWRERKHLLQLRAAIQRSRRTSWLQFYGAFTALPRKLVLLIRHGVPVIDH